MLKKQTNNFVQSAYHFAGYEVTDDIDIDIKQAMSTYLIEDLGFNRLAADSRIKAEISRETPKFILRLLKEHGVNIVGNRVLEIGAGLGGMSEELLINGAKVISLEPGEAWRNLTQRRLQRHHLNFSLLNCPGESIPLDDESVDLIISLQVLEHVECPDAVLKEAWRVLRPGGYFFLSCENYLSFWEPHYCVPWIPLLPKIIGRLYLKLLGRSPVFLDEAITYTTFNSVISVCRTLGFIRRRDNEVKQYLTIKKNFIWKLLRLISSVTAGKGPQILDDAKYMFKPGIQELLWKPELGQS